MINHIADSVKVAIEKRNLNDCHFFVVADLVWYTKFMAIPINENKNKR